MARVGIRLPRGPIMLAHLETNLQGSLIKLEHQPRRACELVELMMKLSGQLLHLVEREGRGARLDVQQRRTHRRARAPASNNAHAQHLE